MKRLIGVYGFFIILFVTACSGATISVSKNATATPTAGASTFVGFSDFLAQVKVAKFSDYAKLPGAKVRDEDAFKTMQSYILQMYDGVQQVSSFVAGERYVDCITQQSQPTVHQLKIQQIATPPQIGVLQGGSDGTAPGTNRYGDSILDQGHTDTFGHALACPEKTVPMQRLQLEIMVRFPTLQAFLTKMPDGKQSDTLETPNRDITPGGPHRYAKGDQYVTNYGGNSWLDLWNPSGEFTLSQQWYAAYTPTHQTVEGGWVNEPGKFGSQSVLFIYWTADDYSSTGCYDLECTGFVQINNHWYLGGPWDHYSTDGGGQWGFEMQWKLYNGNWWLFLKGPGNYEAVGYYPTSIYAGGPIADHAEAAKFGGETYTGGSSWPQMGSGQFPAAGWTHAAYQNTIFYIPHNENGGTGVWSTLSPVITNPACYLSTIVPSSSGGNWGTYLYYGGPGGSCA